MSIPLEAANNKPDTITRLCWLQIRFVGLVLALVSAKYLILSLSNLYLIYTYPRQINDNGQDLSADIINKFKVGSVYNAFLFLVFICASIYLLRFGKFVSKLLLYKVTDEKKISKNMIKVISIYAVALLLSGILLAATSQLYIFNVDGTKTQIIKPFWSIVGIIIIIGIAVIAHLKFANNNHEKN